MQNITIKIVPSDLFYKNNSTEPFGQAIKNKIITLNKISVFNENEAKFYHGKYRYIEIYKNENLSYSARVMGKDYSFYDDDNFSSYQNLKGVRVPITTMEVAVKHIISNLKWYV